MTIDLFGSQPIPGLVYADDALSADQEGALIGHLSAERLAPFRFQGWTGKRLTRTFGWRYDFDDRSFEPTEPIPAWLEPARAAAARLAGIDAAELVHALLVRYDPGAGIGWHRDRPVFETVAGLSLGSPAVLRFRRRKPGGFDRVSVQVEPRSAYVLSGEARHEWEHSIAPGDALRFSITFRTLSELGRRKAAL